MGLEPDSNQHPIKLVFRGCVGVGTSPSLLESKIKSYPPELRFIDAGQLIREMRVIKCEDKLGLSRKAGEMSDWGQVRFEDAIAVGKSRLELGAEVTYKMAIEAAKRFQDYQISVFAGGTGLGPFLGRDDMAFNHRILKAGMATSVEPGIYVYGYGGFRHSDTVIVGKDKPEVTTKNTKKTDRASIT